MDLKIFPIDLLKREIRSRTEEYPFSPFYRITPVSVMNFGPAGHTISCFPGVP